jgi:hypothetical protein
MVYFIVEGQTDKALIKNILQPKEENTDFKFKGLKGISSVIKTLEKLTEHDTSQDTYFAIVDADNSFSNINNQLTPLTKSQDIGFYIFPNHKDDGDLETLLLSNLDKENKILKCFDQYEKCVEKDVDNKAKLYAYTTLELNQRPENYIETLDIKDDFNDLKQKLINLFK